jgi:hypothetical protein
MEKSTESNNIARFLARSRSTTHHSAFAQNKIKTKKLMNIHKIIDLHILSSQHRSSLGVIDWQHGESKQEKDSNQESQKESQKEPQGQGRQNARRFSQKAGATTKRSSTRLVG